ncbi:hypothetical protein LZL87_003917 [Fusarium oxysporum]|nr:hypothetical protein LZL87_003917 [Fusarium oxysporum]
MSNLAYHRGVVRESVIMATSKDGKEFDLAKEPIVSGPPNGEDSFFRDLKVSRDPTDNEWKMAVGATNGENGQVQLYALQWYQDEAGRDLAITWMANWPSPKWPSRVNGWAGQQSITREMFIRKDGGLGQHPILELKTLASSQTKKRSDGVFGYYLSKVSGIAGH